MACVVAFRKRESELSLFFAEALQTLAPVGLAQFEVLYRTKV